MHTFYQMWKNVHFPSFFHPLSIIFFPQHVILPYFFPPPPPFFLLFPLIALQIKSHHSLPNAPILFFLLHIPFFILYMVIVTIHNMKILIQLISYKRYFECTHVPWRLSFYPQCTQIAEGTFFMKSPVANILDLLFILQIQTILLKAFILLLFLNVIHC